VHENWVYDLAARAASSPATRSEAPAASSARRCSAGIAEHREPEHRRTPRRDAPKRTLPPANRRRPQDGERRSKAAPPPRGGDEPQPRLFE